MTATIPAVTPLDEALQAYRDADYYKRQAQITLDVALETVLALLPNRAEEGVTRCDTAYFKASLTSKLNRTLNKPALATFKTDHPELYALLFEEEPTLNLKTLRALEIAHPAEYAQAEQLFIIKPGKPSLKVEVRT